MSNIKITNEKEALAAVRENGSAISDVPKELKTAKVCLEAVKEINERVFKKVPKALRKEVRAMLASSLGG